MKKLFGLLFLITSSISLYAADPLLGGKQAMEAGGAELKSWMWLVSLGVVGLGIAVTLLVYNKTFKSEETDVQHKTSMVKMASILLATFVVTEIVLYLLLGVIGYSFLGMNFGDTWQMFVIKPLRALFGLQ